MVRTATTATFSLPLGPNSRWGLFLDLDGSLLDVCARPDRVVASAEVIRLLPALQQTFGGAVAILSGRTIRDIDRILFPLKLPCVGLHGAERRSTDGILTRIDVDGAAVSEARMTLSSVTARRGMQLEDKQQGFAVHLRATPEDFDAAELSVAAIAERTQGTFRLLRGKNVIELVPRSASIGRAVSAFMGEPAFANRRPLIFGDDAADREAFDEAKQRNGIAIAVGDHEPPSIHRVASPRECRFLLAELVNLGHLGLVA